MRFILSALAALPLAACSVLTPYPQQTANARLSFAGGRFEEALDRLPAPSGPNTLLLQLERGLVLHTAGRFEESNREWLAAQETLAGFEGRPTISLRSSLEGLGSLLLNDQALPYDGEGFERVLLHAYLALNFAFLGDSNGAWVEARRAYEAQREEERRFETSYETQGALALFLSGLMRETDGDLGNAIVSYRQALEKTPDCRALQSDYLRVAEQLGREEELTGFRNRFPGLRLDPLWSDPQAGECVLLFQCGLAPIKVPVELLIPHRDGIARFSAPNYESRPNPVTRLRLLVDGQSAGETDLLEDVEAVARKNLKDRMALVVTKAAARTAGKGYLTHKLQNRYGDWAALLGTLFAVITEQADLRAWLTLPRDFQLLRFPLAPGAHHFSIELLGPGGTVVGQRDLGSIRLRPAERAILSVRSAGLSSFCRILGGESVEP